MPQKKLVPSSSQTSQFYDELINGKVKRGLWGQKKRFDGIAISKKISVAQYFLPNISRYITPNDTVLELGCGPGGFLAAAAPMCKRIVGADISRGFVKQCQRTIDNLKIKNAKASFLPSNKLPFSDNSFDVVIMVDVLHHLDQIDVTLDEVYRVLKPGGNFLIFEPNKLNPALFLMCVFDRNEWGLLSLGSKKRYREVLRERFAINEIDYNGLLVGPDSNSALMTADFLSKPNMDPWLRWLSPKIFIAASSKS